MVYGMQLILSSYLIELFAFLLEPRFFGGKRSIIGMNEWRRNINVNN